MELSAEYYKQMEIGLDILTLTQQSLQGQQRVSAELD